MQMTRKLGGTKFILHGGFNPGEGSENDAFFQEILKSAPQKVDILLVYFAKEENRVDINRKEDVEQFEKNKGNRILSFQTANEEIFRNQMKKADIVYLHGGLSTKLLSVLEKFTDLDEMFKGKIVAGDSAGANVLCKSFYSEVSKDVFNGLGILPLNIVCHYTPTHLGTISRNLDSDVLYLPSYEYKVYWK
ncbi:MAG: Type 1 glutamine amidotransferase-like domain-containing protein [Patescibacteria group bacterium]|nr:Type 1 glutamine amidotransferase-like domain-containing protein [Patescibacteria group bacterium]